MAWTDITLITDADLTAQESRMPALAISIKRLGTVPPASVYDGKRALAKREVAQRLVRMGQVLDTIASDPDKVAALKEVAVYKELSLLYFDLADRNDTVSMDKAKRYDRLYEEAWQDVILALQVPAQQSGIGFIPAYRA